jgi:hypothetical protein
VSDLRLRSEIGKPGLMFIPYYGRPRAFIANYSSWRECSQEDRIAEVVGSLLNHETLHIVINRLSLAASAYLFGRNSLDLCSHDLGDLNRVRRNSAGKNTRKRR